MGELLLGAAIAAIFSFLGGLILALYQARRTETLTLRLRTLELQEQALRALASGLSELEDFRGLVQSPPVTEDVSDVGTLLRRWDDFIEPRTCHPACAALASPSPPCEPVTARPRVWEHLDAEERGCLRVSTVARRRGSPSRR